jgi:hypothetical protein
LEFGIQNELIGAGFSDHTHQTMASYKAKPELSISDLNSCTPRVSVSVRVQDKLNTKNIELDCENGLVRAGGDVLHHFTHVLAPESSQVSRFADHK